MKRVNLVVLKAIPIFQQLRIEEYLLRCTKENYVIINSNIAEPAIVLGFSGKIKDLINIDLVAQDNIQLIRRYSGGGTVICDRSTVFVSFIMNNLDVDVKPYPRDIMTWSEEFYTNIFKKYKIDNFKLRENDYVFGDLKFGGNAQSITRDRWVHHTSFLMDFDPKMMNYLAMPKKQPEYRSNRDHHAFLTKLKDVIPTVHQFESDINEELKLRYQTVTKTSLEVEELVRNFALTTNVVDVIRSKTESIRKVIEERNAIPSLVRVGPSCVNL